MKVKILVLAVDERTTWMVSNAILNEYSDLEVLLLSKHSKKDIFISRYKKSGLLNIIGQIIFILFSKFFLSRKKKYINNLINQANLLDSNFNNIKVTRIPNEEELKVVEYLKKHNPEIVVVNGTKILSNNILNACNAEFINLHCGITPAYRGVHGAYWALVNNDMENCGVTIHQVDSGIDTGYILYQDKIVVSELDNFHVYPIKQYILGIPLMLKAIHDISNNNTCYLKNTLPSKLYQHPTIIKYLYSRLKFGVK
jgi:folate-dependent phosphoribosylglycinamide formyltransferase PurN